MKLSKNFSLEELTKSDTAVRRGISNVPSEDVTNNIQELVDNVLQPVRDRLGPVVVTSGYRSPELNTAIGGSKTSDHCLGMAADIEVLGIDNKVTAEYIRDNLLFTQLILEFYKDGVPDSGWVHVSFDPKDLKKQVLRAEKVNGKTHYSTGV
jgi:hypothetical protein